LGENLQYEIDVRLSFWNRKRPLAYGVKFDDVANIRTLYSQGALLCSEGASTVQPTFAKATWIFELGFLHSLPGSCGIGRNTVRGRGSVG
jgi:hypothetical protein